MKKDSSSSSSNSNSNNGSGNGNDNNNSLVRMWSLRTHHLSACLCLPPALPFILPGAKALCDGPAHPAIAMSSLSAITTAAAAAAPAPAAATASAGCAGTADTCIEKKSEVITAIVIEDSP